MRQVLQFLFGKRQPDALAIARRERALAIDAMLRAKRRGDTRALHKAARTARAATAACLRAELSR